MLGHSVGRGTFLSLLAALSLICGSGFALSAASSRQKEHVVKKVGSLVRLEAVLGNSGPEGRPRFILSKYSGPKVRVSIGESELGEESGREPPCDAISNRLVEDWLATAMVQAEHFDLVAPDHPSASYQVVGSIGDCGPKLETTGSDTDEERTRSWSFPVSIVFRVEDAATGQVVFSTVERSLVSAPKEPRLALAPFRSAVRTNVSKAVDRFVEWSSKRPWRGKVMAVEDCQVTIDAGSRQGLAEAMILRVIASGRKLIDPESGSTLGLISEQSGTLQIVEVGENSSLAAILEGGEEIRRGDRVELVPVEPQGLAVSGDESSDVSRTGDEFPCNRM